MNTLWCEVAMQVVQTHDTKRRGIEIFGGTDNQLAARAESHQPRRVSGQPLHVKAPAFRFAYLPATPLAFQRNLNSWNEFKLQQYALCIECE